MLNQVTLIGRVTEVWDERGAQYVALVTASGNSKGKDWTEIAVVRFYGDSTKYAANLGNGDLVRVDASVKARKKTSGGGYFVDVEARYLKVLSAPTTGTAAQHTRTTSSTKPASDDDSDSLPF